MAEWHDVCAFDDLTEATPLVVALGGQQVGIRRWGERVFAMVNRCGHAGAPIAHGEIFPHMTSNGPGQPVIVDTDRPEVRCPWHHWGFDLATGRCTAPVRRPRLRLFETQLSDGRVLVRV